MADKQPDKAATSASGAIPPPPGTRQGSYVFKGGDPSRKESWELAPELRSGGSALGEQLKRFGKGTAQFVGDVGKGAFGNQESLTRLSKGLTEVVAGPARELTRTDIPLDERAISAFFKFWGGDMDAAREAKARGNTWAAVADLATVPVLNFALSEFLGKAAGEKLPSPESRANKLTYVSGTKAGGGIAKNWQDVLPDLDATVRARGGIKNPAEVTPSWVQGAIRETLDRKEHEFNTQTIPIRTKQVDPVQVAAAIRAKKTPSISAEAKAYNQALEGRAKEFDQPWTWGQLNAERQRLFSLPKSVQVERLSPRTSADFAADRAGESALRDVVYSGADRAVPGVPAGHFARLKAQESKLLTLQDQLGKTLAEAPDKAALSAETPLLQQLDFALRGYPEGGKVVPSFHRIQKLIPGRSAAKVAAGKTRGAFVPKPVIRRAARTAASGTFAGQLGYSPEPEQEQ